MVSRMPPISPARTSCTKRASKTLGCSASASAKVEPDSTLAFTVHAARCGTSGLSAWVPMMSSAWTSGRPASIITENWRVKTRMSFSWTPPTPGILRRISLRLLLDLGGLDAHLAQAGLDGRGVLRLDLAGAHLALLALPGPLPDRRLLHRRGDLGLLCGGCSLGHVRLVEFSAADPSAARRPGRISGGPLTAPRRGCGAPGRAVPMPLATRFFSSSWSEERLSASSRVMSRLATAAASLWLKVCMPNLVWPTCICE